MRTARLIIFILLPLFSGVLLLEACKKKQDAGSVGTPLKFTIPNGWPQPAKNYFQDNPPTQEGFDLGKKLFYDGRLSKDGSVPCASCHQQFAGFANFDHDFSHGFNNSFTTRNAQGLANLAWMPEFMWDGGINHIELQPLAPIQAQNEMAETLESVLGKLNADATYKQMFKAAFGDEQITSQRMLKAMAQFMLFLVSSNAKYDKMKRGELSFTTTEQRGYTLFQGKCASCHKEPLFTDFSYRNIGLTLNAQLKDRGRMRITNNIQDSLKFKVPSLRNVQYSFPYTHDGRFYSLEQMIDHYRSGVVNGPTTDPLVANKIPLTLSERSDLIQFLYTLSDTTFIRDPRFKL